MNQQEHERLLEDWSMQQEHRGQTFIRDGVIDLKRWNHVSRRVLFLLREAYDKDKRPGGFDLRRQVREKWKGPKGKTWCTMANWAFAAIHGTQTGIPELTADEKKRRADALLSSAVVNIKKSRGQTTSKREEILTYAERDTDFLKRQIELIAPDLVVCGNTWGAVPLIFPEPQAERIYANVWRIGTRWFINCWHPANRYPKDLNYYGFACQLQNCGWFDLVNKKAP